MRRTSIRHRRCLKLSSLVQIRVSSLNYRNRLLLWHFPMFYSNPVVPLGGAAVPSVSFPWGPGRGARPPAPALPPCPPHAASPARPLGRRRCRCTWRAWTRRSRGPEGPNGCHFLAKAARRWWPLRWSPWRSTAALVRGSRRRSAMRSGQPARRRCGEEGGPGDVRSWWALFSPEAIEPTRPWPSRTGAWPSSGAGSRTR